ncbi:hypothetical protein KSX_52050 [Ktedonospora formicarum]|uniref:Uncharacterized protein n=1 Tax=Ktedonospora formicarum TaxID=2778364 RepID=A0A8J3HZF3_9CHLR|nr:hypothetical protein KSX_52050 [Ktedonospora formicarum]
MKPAITTDNACSAYTGALKIYSDANYQGSMICFIGTGWADLTQYWLFWPVSWNDQASSFYGGCNNGTFYQNVDKNTHTGWGNSQSFGGAYNWGGNFDGLNGHLPNDSLSAILITSSCNY